MHDGLLAPFRPEEVEQVLAVHFYPLQRLARDLRSACPACRTSYLSYIRGKAANMLYAEHRAPLTISEAAVRRGCDEGLPQHELPVSMRHAVALVAFHLPCIAAGRLSLCSPGLRLGCPTRLQATHNLNSSTA